LIFNQPPNREPARNLAGGIEMTTTNTGYRNTGNRNTGDCNTGYRNTGYCNTGDWNTGDRNTGDCNTGNRNTGNGNTGDCNTGDWNTGFFNVDEPNIRMFGKDTGMKRGDVSFPDFFYISLTEWITSAKMSDSEKTEHPSHTTTGGYLKSCEYKEAWRIAWDKADETERKKTLDLPNFDADMFLEITGIDVRKEFSDKVTLTVEGRDVEISRESAKALGLVE